MHVNLFGYAEDSDAVYKAMQDHMKRDHRYFNAWCIGMAICFLRSASLGVPDGWGWFLGGIACALCALVYFIDNSNRNFYLHAVDWYEARRVMPSSK